MLTRWLIYLVVSLALAAASPLAATLLQAEVGSGGFVEWWFFFLPHGVEGLIHSSPAQRIWVWTTVYTLQYLAVFGIVSGLVHLVRSRDTIERRVAFDTAVKRYYQSEDGLGQ